jgi:hypothetical protein
MTFSANRNDVIEKFYTNVIRAFELSRDQSMGASLFVFLTLNLVLVLRYE